MARFVTSILIASAVVAAPAAAQTATTVPTGAELTRSVAVADGDLFALFFNEHFLS